MTQAADIILSKLTAINLNVAIWAPKGRLSAQDFNGAELPAAELAALGSKKICDPQSLKIFSALKASAINLLELNGTPFIGGFVVPENRALDLRDRLVDIQTDFQEAKLEFIEAYAKSLESWLSAHPQWEETVASSTISAKYIQKDFYFNWLFYKVSVPDRRIGDNLIYEVEALGDRLFYDISKSARNVWANVYEGTSQVSHDALMPLRFMRDKLGFFSFVEPKALGLANLIGEALNGIPKRGQIKDQTLIRLKALLSMLQNPDEILEYAQKISQGVQSSIVLDSIIRSFDPKADIKIVEDSPLGFADYNIAAGATNLNDSMDEEGALDSLGLW
ncbi:MAG: DUF3150 domain-containing protein [Deltaproteobacteria bacterium]|jgi:hypothetical protein|nr:DUF3150 domain-containing protein [Deltaproteobacteria bacterium]